MLVAIRNAWSLPMPTRHTITSRCLHFDNGDRYMVAILPPRPIMVMPDEWPVQVARRCRWLLLRRWWTKWTG